MSGEFPCTSCGACCKFVGHVREFTEPARPNGWCVHLDSANRCVIYRDRPDTCRVRPGTHLANARVCGELQDLLQIKGKQPDRAKAAVNDKLYRASRLTDPG